jgi:AcrR family transcriptional regulator
VRFAFPAMSVTGLQPPLHPRKRPSQARSAVTVDAILEAAVRVLLADGYPRLTTRRVAEVAGVSVGSLYQYFPNRRSLVAEVIRRKVEEGVRCIEEAAARADGPPAEAVAAVMAAFAAEKRRGLALSVALRGPMAELEGRRALAEGARRAEAILAGLLGRLLSRPLDAAEAARLALAVAALEGAVAAAAERDPAAFSDAALGAVLARMLLGALDLG